VLLERPEGYIPTVREVKLILIDFQNLPYSIEDLDYLEEQFRLYYKYRFNLSVESINSISETILDNLESAPETTSENPEITSENHERVV